jgi:large subunit ribosomal protein L35
MPKMKTHSGAKKRFRKTAKGKLRGRRAYSSHILEKKRPKRKRRFARPVEIKAQDRARVRALLAGKGRS